MCCCHVPINGDLVRSDVSEVQAIVLRSQAIGVVQSCNLHS
jgi:hypothetical protein